MPGRIDMVATISHALTDLVATVVVEAMLAVALACAAAINEFLVWRKVVFMLIKKSKTLMLVDIVAGRVQDHQDIQRLNLWRTKTIECAAAKSENVSLA
jgi:hypothetical protein